jgi:hypothetical protein
VIDFRYHLVSIVAVFLALAIGIVLGSTALQGDTIDALKSINNSTQNQLNAANAANRSYAQQVSNGDTFVQTAEPALLKDMLTGDKIVLVTEPGAPSAVISGIQQAAADAGATITGTVALQLKFNDLSAPTLSILGQLNAQLGSTDGIALSPPADTQTVYQQQAAQLIADALLDKTAGQSALPSSADARTTLNGYENGGYLTVSSGNPTAGATLAVIVTPPATAADGPSDPADEVLPALATEFAEASAATVVAGPTMTAPASSSAISVLRSDSTVSGLVSTVDNADSKIGQISVIWALANQLQGGKPNSYGVSGASAVSPPVPSPVPSATPTVSATPTAKATGKVKKP